MARRRRSPQEKKALSYERDTRNVRGESGSSARKGVRQRKRWVNASYRSNVQQALTQLDEDQLDDGAVEAIERPGWRKVPDAPLGQVVEWQLGRRTRDEKTESSAPSRLLRSARRKIQGPRSPNRY